MALTFNGTTGISGVDGSASAAAIRGSDSNTGLSFGTDIVNINTGGVTRATLESNGRLGLGIASPDTPFHLRGSGFTTFTMDNSGNTSSPYKITYGDQGQVNHIVMADRELTFATNNATRIRCNNNGGVHIGGVLSNTFNLAGAGVTFSGTEIGGTLGFNGVSIVKSQTNWGTALYINRNGSGDGMVVEFAHDSVTEGQISISGSTVSYNGGHLSRWSQIKGLSTTDKSARPTIYQGTVLSNLDDLCSWSHPDVFYTETDKNNNEIPEDKKVGDLKTAAFVEENQQLNMTKVSDTEGDKDVAGVFWTWDDTDDTFANDFFVAMTGDMVIRVAASTTVARGDLLISAGDGTAKPQADDIVRSSTIAKIISTNHTATYADGSKAYPCVLMAC